MCFVLASIMLFCLFSPWDALDPTSVRQFSVCSSLCPCLRRDGRMTAKKRDGLCRRLRPVCTTRPRLLRNTREFGCVFFFLYQKESRVGRRRASLSSIADDHGAATLISTCWRLGLFGGLLYRAEHPQILFFTRTINSMIRPFDGCMAHDQKRSR